jgi:hypothetical protein
MWALCREHLHAPALARGLLAEWPDMAQQPRPLKEAWLAEVVNLVCMVLLLGAQGALQGGGGVLSEAAHQFRAEVAHLQVRVSFIVHSCRFTFIYTMDVFMLIRISLCALGGEL